MFKKKYADDIIKKQKTKIRRYENKTKRELYKVRVKARREEKARLKFLFNNQKILGAYILIISQESIRDSEKNPLLKEIEAVRIKRLILYEELDRFKKEVERVKSDNLKVFTTILIDFEILKIEYKFKLI
jgi:hypothetical protein